jgi:hypothetical protein
VAHPVFRGEGLSNSPISAPSRALPRRRTFGTNSKKPRSNGRFSGEIPRWGRSHDRRRDQNPAIGFTGTAPNPAPSSSRANSPAAGQTVRGVEPPSGRRAEWASASVATPRPGPLSVLIRGPLVFGVTSARRRRPTAPGRGSLPKRGGFSLARVPRPGAVALDHAAAQDLRVPEHDPRPQRGRPPPGVVRVEVEVLGARLVREVPAPEGQDPDPDPPRWGRPGDDRVGPVIAAAAAGPALVPRPARAWLDVSAGQVRFRHDRR